MTPITTFFCAFSGALTVEIFFIHEAARRTGRLPLGYRRIVPWFTAIISACASGAVAVMLEPGSRAMAIQVGVSMPCILARMRATATLAKENEST